MAKVGAVPSKAAAPVAAPGVEAAKWEERARIAESDAALRRLEADIKRIAAEEKLRELTKAPTQR